MNIFYFCPCTNAPEEIIWFSYEYPKLWTSEKTLSRILFLFETNPKYAYISKFVVQKNINLLMFIHVLFINK